MINYEEIRQNTEINAYIQKGNDVLGVMGFTDHGFAHAGLSAKKPRKYWKSWDMTRGRWSWPR